MHTDIPSISALQERLDRLEVEITLLRQRDGPAKRLQIAMIVLVITLLAAPFLEYEAGTDEGLADGYLIQNLRGDEMETSAFWNLPEGQALFVNVAGKMPDGKMKAIENAILSTERVQIEDSVLHKGPPGASSEYFVGWKGALGQIRQTSLYVPKEIQIHKADSGNAHVIVKPTSYSDPEGLAASTKSMVDRETGQILKSTITIYDFEDLSEYEIETIVRHEFGHALGLGHSTAPEDLMNPTISTAYPYISQCNIDALSDLYGGNPHGSIICEK